MQIPLPNMPDTAPLKAYLDTRPRRVAITTHQRPDGDAIGSSLGLYHFLTGLGHKVSVVTPTDYADFLKWLPGNDHVLVGPDDVDKAKWTFDGADIIFCLDFNALHRIGEFRAVVKDSDAVKVLMDHHLDPEDFAEYKFWDATASSAAEMVFRLIVDMGQGDAISQECAQALYVGLMTDTGSFRFTSTTPAVHQMAAKLLEAGADPNLSYDKIFNQASETRLKLIGHALSNCLHILPELRTAYIKLERPVFKQFNVKTGDTEGLVNYALGMKGIDLAILMTTQDDLVKLSIRSRSGVSSSDFAAHFEGGGHFYAAGGRSKGTVEETETRMLELLKTYMATQPASTPQPVQDA
ncbi:MAG: DHH family phosphoesterase [Bacteroidota bacterium]